jgi:hypothetical protein
MEFIGEELEKKVILYEDYMSKNMKPSNMMAVLYNNLGVFR